jgi:hypothetical protein
LIAATVKAIGLSRPVDEARLQKASKAYRIWASTMWLPRILTPTA